MIFLPANASFSIDNLISKKSYRQIPKWTVDCLKLMIVIVYFYAGLAKINSDWLLEAMPLKIWLSTRYHFPLVGETLYFNAFSRPFVLIYTGQTELTLIFFIPNSLDNDCVIPFTPNLDAQ